MIPLPAEIGLPDPKQVAEDNPHGDGWTLTESGDQGPKAHRFDRYFATYRDNAHGWRADYFHVDGRWVLGAN